MNCWCLLKLRYHYIPQADAQPSRYNFVEFLGTEWSWLRFLMPSAAQLRTAKFENIGCVTRQRTYPGQTHLEGKTETSFATRLQQQKHRQTKCSRICDTIVVHQNLAHTQTPWVLDKSFGKTFETNDFPMLCVASWTVGLTARLAWIQRVACTSPRRRITTWPADSNLTSSLQNLVHCLLVNSLFTKP